MMTLDSTLPDTSYSSLSDSAMYAALLVFFIAAFIQCTPPQLWSRLRARVRIPTTDAKIAPTVSTAQDAVALAPSGAAFANALREITATLDRIDKRIAALEERTARTTPSPVTPADGLRALGSSSLSPTSPPAAPLVFTSSLNRTSVTPCSPQWRPPCPACPRTPLSTHSRCLLCHCLYALDFFCTTTQTRPLDSSGWDQRQFHLSAAPRLTG